jgi:hypothetical protein
MDKEARMSTEQIQSSLMRQSLRADEHNAQIDGHPASVTGKTGPIHATWTLLK